MGRLPSGVQYFSTWGREPAKCPKGNADVPRRTGCPDKCGAGSWRSAPCEDFARRVMPASAGCTGGSARGLFFMEQSASSYKWKRNAEKILARVYTDLIEERIHIL